VPKSNEIEELKAIISGLHKDCQNLTNFIISARTEIAEIRPSDLQEDKLPRAGKELDAIVEATETATNQIMTATEKIMAANDIESDVVNEACMEIFEACSFQDITGQRISKVVSTLDYVEDHMTRLIKAWGYESEDAPPTEVPEDSADDSGLLNGPALAGEGVDQDFVDQIFEEDTSADRLSEKKQKPSPSSSQQEIDALFD
jgi:chemotaxis protein CheZ